jgi:hypothetical protein
MAIDLKRITRGRIEHAPRVVVWGFDGVGKTGFAAGAPEPFILDANKGSLEYNVARLLIDSWDDARECMTAVETGAIKCKTFVLDSLSDLEAMSHAHLFPGTTMNKYEGGYGKGADLVMSEWRGVLSQLERIWRKGIGIVIVAHGTVKRFDDPTGPGYDRFEIAAQQRLAGAVRQWVDYVLFAREEVVTAGAKNEAKRATTTGVRWLYTSRKPAYDAKARGSSLFPERIPLSWRDFDVAMRSDASRLADLTHEIEAMLKEIDDESYASQVRGYLKEYPAGIVEARNRVAAKLDEVRATKTEGSK